MGLFSRRRNPLAASDAVGRRPFVQTPRLLRMISLWVALALLAFTFVGSLWVPLRENFPWDGSILEWLSWLVRRTFSVWINPESAERFEAVKTALATVGGIGGVTYLVIKYRERSDVELERQDRLDSEAARSAEAREREASESLAKAVLQLGSESPQVRIAGVYALADVADRHRGAYKQRVVDILCGYLRVDRYLRGVNELDEAYKQLRDAGRWGYAKEVSLGNIKARLYADAAVESTIFKVIGARVQMMPLDDSESDQGDTSWSSCTFDIHGAVIHEDVNLSKAIFLSDFNASNAIFIGSFTADSSEFCGDVCFSGVMFLEHASFAGVVFGDFSEFSQCLWRAGAKFDNSHFMKTCDSRDAEYRRLASFDGVVFLGDAAFEGSRYIGKAWFIRTHFWQGVWFERARFHEEAWFEECTFHKGVWFDGASFQQGAYFNGAVFKGARSFKRTILESDYPSLKPDDPAEDDEGLVVNRRIRHQGPSSSWEET